MNFSKVISDLRAALSSMEDNISEAGRSISDADTAMSDISTDFDTFTEILDELPEEGSEDEKLLTKEDLDNLETMAIDITDTCNKLKSFVYKKRGA